MLPSVLPPEEIDLLRDSFHASLLRSGLRSGVMHVEGRVNHSKVTDQVKDGIVDLRLGVDGKVNSERQGA